MINFEEGDFVVPYDRGKYSGQLGRITEINDYCFFVKFGYSDKDIEMQPGSDSLHKVDEDRLLECINNFGYKVTSQ